MRRQAFIGTRASCSSDVVNMAFNMTSMRLSLGGISLPRRAVQPAAAAPATVSLSVPSFNGLALCTRWPSFQGAESSTASPLLSISNGCRVLAMRHGNRVKRLGRPADQRKALVRGLVTEVLRHGRIVTTKTKAKAIRKYVDKMITLAKNGSLHARRQALAFVYDDSIVKALFDEAPKRYESRASGYCRVIAEPRLRRGDGAEMAAIELV